MTQQLDLDALQAAAEAARNLANEWIQNLGNIGPWIMVRDQANTIDTLIDRLHKVEAASKWQLIETAPKDELVVVMWLDQDDAEHPERYDFDWLEDGCWIQHNENREHFLIAAPPGSQGASEKAPYTHWKRLAAPTSADSEGENNG